MGLCSELILCSGCLDDGLVRNDIACGDKGDAADFFGVGDGGRGADGSFVLFPTEKCSGEKGRDQNGSAYSNGFSFIDDAKPGYFFAHEDPRRPFAFCGAAQEKSIPVTMAGRVAARRSCNQRVT